MFIQVWYILALGFFLLTVFSPFMEHDAVGLIWPVTLYPSTKRFAARLER